MEACELVQHPDFATSVFHLNKTTTHCFDRNDVLWCYSRLREHADEIDEACIRHFKTVRHPSLLVARDKHSGQPCYSKPNGRILFGSRSRKVNPPSARAYAKKRDD